MGAGVVELVDALDSKSSVPLGRVGSSPTSGTNPYKIHGADLRKGRLRVRSIAASGLLAPDLLGRPSAPYR